MTEENMKLPKGKTCGDCHHFARCERMISCKPSNTSCDWSPSKFVERCNPAFKQLYLGTAQLLVETHNQLVSSRWNEGGVGEEQMDVMEQFAADFNEAVPTFRLTRAGGQRFGIFDRDDVDG